MDMATVCEDYRPLVLAAAGQRFLRTMREDAISECYALLLSAAREYDAGRGVPFPAFAASRVYKGIWTWARREFVRWGRECCMMGDNAAAVFERVPDDGERRRREDFLDRDELRAALGFLSDYQREVVQMVFIRDIPQKEVAARYGKTQQAISKTCRKAIEELRKTLALWRSSGI